MEGYAIDEMNVKAMRKRSGERNERKGKVAKHILTEVKLMKETAGAISIGERNVNSRPAEWREYIRSLRPPDYYS